MIWRRNARSATAPAEVAAPGPANEAPAPVAPAKLEDAITTLGSVLRSLGQIGFPVSSEPSSFAADCEAWARHVATGTTPPGAPTPVVGERRWRAVRDFVRARRVEERDFVQSRLLGFTDLIRDVMQQMQSLSSASEEAGGSIHATMQQLEAAAGGASLEELRAAVAAATRDVRRAVEDQRMQVSQRMTTVSERLASARADLEGARECADIDALTKLGGPGAFASELDRFTKVAEASGLAITVLVLDVDGFGRINEAHGREVGDEVLRAVADCVSLCFYRKSDLVARIGPDEVGVMLWDTEVRPARRNAERALAKLRKLRVRHEGASVPVSVSAGAAQRRLQEPAPDLVARARVATARARDRGGDMLEIG